MTSSSSKAAETTKEAAQSKAIAKRNHAFSGGVLAGQNSRCGCGVDTDVLGDEILHAAVISAATVEQHMRARRADEC